MYRLYSFLQSIMKQGHRNSAIILPTVMKQRTKLRTQTTVNYVNKNIFGDDRNNLIQENKFLRSFINITWIVDYIINQSFQLFNKIDYHKKLDSCIKQTFSLFDHNKYQLCPNSISKQQHWQPDQQPQAPVIDGKTTFQIQWTKGFIGRNKRLQKLTQATLREVVEDQNVSPIYTKRRQQPFNRIQSVIPLPTSLTEETAQIEFMRIKLLKQQKTKFASKKEYLSKRVIENLKRRDPKSQQFTFGYSGEKIPIKQKNVRKIQLNVTMNVMETENNSIKYLNQPEIVRKQNNLKYKQNQNQKIEPFNVHSNKRLFKEIFQNQFLRGSSVHLRIKQIERKNETRSSIRISKRNDLLKI